MTTPDELRRLAERVERGGDPAKPLNLAFEILQALGSQIATESRDIGGLSEAIINTDVYAALHSGSVDAAKRLLPENMAVWVGQQPDWSFKVISDSKCPCRAHAQDEAHARTALALRVRAEQEDSHEG